MLRSDESACARAEFKAGVEAFLRVNSIVSGAVYCKMFLT